NWSLVGTYAEVLKVIGENTIEVTKENISGYLKEVNALECTELLEEQLNNLAMKIASELEKKSEVAIGEVALIFEMDKEENLSLLEANPGGPVTIYDSELLASSMITYAKSLAEKDTIISKE